MAAFDKMVIVEKLEKLGWENVGNGYDMKPPESLFSNKPETFSIYLAETLQNILGELVDNE